MTLKYILGNDKYCAISSSHMAIDVLISALLARRFPPISASVCLRNVVDLAYYTMAVDFLL